MHVSNLLNRIRCVPGTGASSRVFARKRASLLACLVAVTFLCCAAQSGQNAQTAGTEKTLQTSERTRQTTTGQPVSDQSTNAGDALTDDQKPAANNPSERERKVAADKARLLKLAK